MIQKRQELIGRKRCALDRYNGSLIVVDFGTATTFDVVTLMVLIGGVIAPGINLSLEALYNAAARLPRISISETKTNESSIKLQM